MVVLNFSLQVCRGTNSDEEDDVLQDNNGGSVSNTTRIANTTMPRVPPPGHTSGKWVPGKQVRLDDGGSTRGGSIDNMLLIPPLRKSGSTIQYWCGPCNRRLSSRTLYERHLLSELHFKRTVQEQELEERPIRTQDSMNARRIEKRTVKRTEVYLNSEMWARSKRRRLNSGTVSSSSGTCFFHLYRIKHEIVVYRLQFLFLLGCMYLCLTLRSWTSV
jgi:hypothetical protein